MIKNSNQTLSVTALNVFVR